MRMRVVLAMLVCAMMGLAAGGCEKDAHSDSKPVQHTHAFVSVVPGTGLPYVIDVPAEQTANASVIGKKFTVICPHCVTDAKAFSATNRISDVCTKCGAVREPAFRIPASSGGN